MAAAGATVIECHECGTENPATARFCNGCGAGLGVWAGQHQGAREAPTMHHAPVPAAAVPVPKRRRPFHVTLALVLGLFVVVVLVLAVGLIEFAPAAAHGFLDFLTKLDSSMRGR